MSTEKAVTELEYYEAKKSLEKKLILMAIGFVIGIAMGISQDMGFLTIIIGIFCMTIPYAWTVIPISVWGIIGIILKAMLAVLIGWIVTPISLIYTLVKLFSVKKELGI